MSNLKEITLLFLKLGFIAFGGPAAHIALMEEEVVNKHKWMDRQYFLDLIGATNLIPGPNSTQMALHCGLHMGGFPGLLAAGLAFVTPAALITGILAFVYVEFGNLPAVEPFFYGIKPAVLIVILMAIYRLSQKALKGWKLAIIGFVVLMITLFGLSEIYAILAGGVVGMLWLYFSNPENTKKSLSMLIPFSILGLWKNVKALIVPSLGAIAGSTVSSLGLFWVFLKVGAILFGSGYVLVAYLDAELVNRLGWLTRQELLDAIAIGQFTPGPLLSSATFVGYQLMGFSGAVISTIAIILPSFMFVYILNPLVPRLRKSKLTAGFLDAVNISAVAIMISVVIKMSMDILLDWRAAAIAVISLVLMLVFKKLGNGWIILLGALSGYVLLLF